jgi:hypothetical protein
MSALVEKVLDGEFRLPYLMSSEVERLFVLGLVFGFWLVQGL